MDNPFKRYWAWRKRKRQQQSWLFRTTEDGRDVFYPWYYPGVGFYVDERQKKQISWFLFTMAFTFVLACVVPDVAYRYGPMNVYASLIIKDFIIWIILPILYFYKVCNFTKHLESKAYERRSPPKIFYVLLVILCIHLFTIWAIFHVSPVLYNSFTKGVVMFHTAYAGMVMYLALKSLRTVFQRI